MAKFFIIENEQDLGQVYLASILGGYDSPDTDRLVVMLRYSRTEEPQYSDYPWVNDNGLELKVLTLNN